MASVSSNSSCDEYTATTVSDVSSTTNSSVSSRYALHQVQQEAQAHRDRIEFLLGIWEAVSFPCLYPSEQIVVLERNTSFDARCKAWNPGTLIDHTTPWLLSSVVIPSRDEEGPLASLFADLPEISRTTLRRREFAHKILLTLTQDSSGSLTKLLTIPCLLRKCITALRSVQRYNIPSLDVVDHLNLRLTLYRVLVAAVWQRTQYSLHRVSIAYHYILKDQRKVVLVLSNIPGACFTRLLELTFDQVLYSAQESLVFEPLFEEDGHGFKIEPKLDDIY